MKTVILCGGRGTRLGEVTQDTIPKPMAMVGERPILDHLMRYYYSYGHREFILCAGHLSWSIKNYFLTMRDRFCDLKIDFSDGSVVRTSREILPDWEVTIAETGSSTMTAGRVRKILDYLGTDDNFMLTYGDGLADIDLDALLAFHRSHGAGMTMTGVIPPGRFGEIISSADKITEWAEKPQQSNRYINGGFMVLKSEFAREVLASCGDDVMLEREPFEKAALAGQMMLYRHEGFWQCMDTTRDWNLLNSLWRNDNAPWIR